MIRNALSHAAALAVTGGLGWLLAYTLTLMERGADGPLRWLLVILGIALVATLALGALLSAGRRA